MDDDGGDATWSGEELPLEVHKHPI